MRISDWSSDVCSSDLIEQHPDRDEEQDGKSILQRQRVRGRPMTEIAFAEDHASKEGAECEGHAEQGGRAESDTERGRENRQSEQFARARSGDTFQYPGRGRSEEHTSELKSLMSTS